MFMRVLTVRMRKHEFTEPVAEFFSGGTFRFLDDGHFRNAFGIRLAEASPEGVEPVWVWSHFRASEMFKIFIGPVVERLEFRHGFGDASGGDFDFIRGIQTGNLNAAVAEQLAADRLELQPAPLRGFELVIRIFQLVLQDDFKVGGNVYPGQFAGNDFFHFFRGQHG